jgi:hypothetical protein
VTPCKDHQICKHENKGELSHSPQYGIEDEERGSWGQSEVKVQGEGGVFGQGKCTVKAGLL